MDSSPRRTDSLTILMLPIRKCNLCCSYCYQHEERSSTHETMEGNIDKILNNILQSRYTQFEFVWHGGEVMLLPLSFLRKVHRIQTMFPDKRVFHRIQTNLTVLSDEVMEFIKESGIGISTSLDGPKLINDLTRKGPGIESVFDLVERNVQSLRSHGIGVSVNCVVSRTNLKNLVDTYEYFESQRMDVQFSPIIPSHLHRRLMIDPKSFAGAMIEVFDAWFSNEDSHIDVLNFDFMIDGLITNHPRSCIFAGSCLESIVRVLPDGEVHPCFSSGRRAESLGSILVDSIDRILDSKKAETIRCETFHRVASACAQCRYYGICNGGCPRNSRGPTMEGCRDFYCVYYKLMFAHIERRLECTDHEF